MLSREEALNLVRKHVSKKNIVYHMLAVEAIMRGIAGHLGEDAEVWGLVGLLHDIDYEQTEASPEKHSLLAERILKGVIPDEQIRAIKTHNSKYTRVVAETRMEKALAASDAVSGLLVACALVMPSKKLAELKVESVAKKFKDKDFARGADREMIDICEEIGISRYNFFETALSSLKKTALEIGL